MDIEVIQNERGLLIVSAVGIVLSGVALVVITWQNLQLQKKAVDDHLRLSAAAISRGVELNLFRSLRWLKLDLSKDKKRPIEKRIEIVQPYLRELIKKDEIPFISIYLAPKQIFLTSNINASKSFAPDQKIFLHILHTGQWSGRIKLAGQSVFVYGRQTQRPFVPFFQGLLGPGPVRRPKMFLFIGLNMRNHMATYSLYKKTAWVQTGFTLLVVLFIWALVVAFLRRRELVTQYGYLQTFHSKLLDNIPDGIITLGASGQITSSNPGAKIILDEPALIGKSIDSVLPMAVQSKGKRWQELPFNQKELEILTLPLDTDQEQYLLLIRDRTEQKHLSQELERSKHLATIGQMATHLAHEIRNPLSALRGFAQFFCQKFMGQEPAQTYAKTMVQEADRLNRVITDLLYLARPRPLKYGPVDLELLFADLQNLLLMDCSDKEVSLQARFEVVKVWADQDYLKQLLINLLLNSLGAIEHPGTKIEIGSLRTASGVEIYVQDAGKGMDQQLARKAFDPFFTTKEQGSGLGLAIVQRIVEAHGGKIDLETAPGRGTKVRVFFPDKGQEQS